MSAAKSNESARRKTWLAGLGTFLQSVEKTTEKLDKVYIEGNALVQALLERGEVIDAELRANLKETVMIEDKIAFLKAKLGMQNDNQDVQLERLSAKIDNLIEVVAKLAQQQAAEKSTPKKAATTTKTTATKAPAKSTAAKSTASKSTSTKSTGSGRASSSTTKSTTSTAKKTTTKGSTASKSTTGSKTTRKPAASKSTSKS